MVLGRLGPTQSQCDTSYNGTNVNVTINTNSEWTVPVSGSYKITAIGAAGGDNTAVLDSVLNLKVESNRNILFTKMMFIKY